MKQARIYNSICLLPRHTTYSLCLNLTQRLRFKKILKMKDSMHLNHSSASLLEPKAASLAAATTK
jgi:hypothetical protein